MCYDGGNCGYGSSAKDDLDVTGLNVFLNAIVSGSWKKDNDTMITDLQLYAQGYMLIEKMFREFDSEFSL